MRKPLNPVKLFSASTLILGFQISTHSPLKPRQKKLLRKPTEESVTRSGVVRCLVAGKLSDGDPLLDVPDPDAGQVAALTRHQVPPVLRPDKRKINQLESQTIRQIISNR